MRHKHIHPFLLYSLLGAGLFFYTDPVLAQQTGERKSPPGNMQRALIGVVSMRIVDQQGNSPIDYATVAFFQSGKFVGGGSTNAKGEVRVEGLPLGTLEARVSFMGYKPQTINNVTLSKEKPEVYLGEVKLTADAKQLQEVSVTAQKDAMETSIDKKRFNVGSDLNAVGGSAADIMRSIPTLNVDTEGNIKLRGSSNLTLLIDGKPTTLSVTDALQQLPAASIQSVEVITNPSAKYDAETTSGIINIILKKENRKGMNGNIGLSIGTRDKYSGNVGFNLNTGKLNFSTSYSYREENRFIIGNSQQSAAGNLLLQDSDGDFSMKFHSLRTGLDYYLDSYNTITLSANANTRDIGHSSLTDISLNRIGDGSNIYRRENSSSFGVGGFSPELRADYMRTFLQPGKELTASLSYNFSDMDRNNLLIDRMLSDNSASAQKNTSANTFGIGIAQLDFTTPIKNGKLSTGYKATYRGLNSNQSWLVDKDNSGNFLPRESGSGSRDKFDYNEIVNAGYVTYGNSIGKRFGYQLGMRVENAEVTTVALDGVSRKRNFLNAFPSVFLTQKIGSKGEAVLSYSRRINRPNPRSLNPFPVWNSNNSVWMGNPNLKPEMINSLEGSYTHTLEKVTLTGSVFYKYGEGIMKNVKSVDQNNVELSTVANLGSSSHYGSEIIVSYTPAKWWKLNGSYSLFYLEVDGGNAGEQFNSQTTAWTSKLNSSFTLGKGFELQASWQYASAIREVQDRTAPMYNVDLALQKRILKNQGSLSLRVSDIFDQRVMRYETFGNGFFGQGEMKRESRVAYLSFSYAFGKMEGMKKKKTPKREDMGGEDMF